MGRLRLSGVLWRERDFLRLWAGQSVSMVGSQVSSLALPLVAIVLLHASTFEVAALGVVEFLPFVVLTLPAGVWVDRLRRRPILVGADWGRAAVLASIPLAYGIGGLTLGQLFACGFLTGVFTVFFDVAYQSYLPSLVARENVMEGNAKLEFSRAGSQVAGPSIAGALIGAFTAAWAVLVDAVSFGSVCVPTDAHPPVRRAHPTLSAKRARCGERSRPDFATHGSTR